MHHQSNREELRTLRCQRRIERLVQLRAEACHLRDVAANLALQPRRSLRIQWQRDNAPSIQQRGEPWYTLILYGEDDYWVNGGPSPVGYHCLLSLPTPRAYHQSDLGLSKEIITNSNNNKSIFGNFRPILSPTRLDSDHFLKRKKTINLRKYYNSPIATTPKQCTPHVLSSS